MVRARGAVALALGGAVALWLPAFRYRIDAATCGSWPAPLGAGAGFALAYVLGVALLSLAWLRAMRVEWTLGRALLAGALVHAVAMVAPPFASNDPLFYAAIGRSMARFHAAASTPLSLVLPHADRFWTILPNDAWRGGTSPYGAAFNQICRLIATVGGDDLTLQLRLFQGLNLAVLVAAAALAGRAFGARAAALLLFAPVAVIDGTVNPHNDALIALAVAAFALALARTPRREGAGLVALVAALFVKLTAALVVAFDLLRLALEPFAARLRARTVVAAGIAAAVTGVAALVIAPRVWPPLHAFTAILGDPAESSPQFSRSWEGLPRAFLVYVVHWPTPSWIIGLVFRAAGGVWILWCAFRAARDRAVDERAPLAWAATLLFVYYLCLHAFLQSWYLLPLLPLATQLPRFAERGFAVFIICLAMYYALAIPLDCDLRPVVIGAKEFAEAALVVLPAFFTLLVGWRDAKARASGGTSPRAA
ncbi:MAG TPA: glycosyltransferase 87 family protein [Polyangia bacterium]|nr:glycosyltransferase 87 family protein [Polyangia bacterium]